MEMYGNKTNGSVSNPVVKQHKKVALDGTATRKETSVAIPHVSFTLFRVSLLDIDAQWGSVKDLLDGLQIAGIIPGDRVGQITLHVEQEKVKRRSEERTEIQITIP